MRLWPPAFRCLQSFSVAGLNKDARRNSEACKPVERALAELGIEWKNVMAFRVHGDRVVIIEGPVGYKRTW